MKKLPALTKPRKPPTRHRDKKPATSPKAPIRSQNLLDHSFDPETGQLTVTFAGGRRYRYAGIDADLFANFEGADSKSKFLSRSIIGKFDCNKIDD